MTSHLDTSLLEKVTYHSATMKKVREIVDPLVHSAVPIFFWGETGSGAAFYARAINAASREGEFVRFSLVSSDVDQVKQSFFGTDEQQGWLGKAHNSTILIRELNEVPLEVQQFLLHLLKIQSVDGRIGFSKMGRAEKLEMNVRFIYSVSGNPETMIREELLSRDLVDLIRRKGRIIELPPLRERKEDIIDIAKNFFKDLNRDRTPTITFIDRKAQKLLMNYYWPGNIDELKQVITDIFKQNPEINTILAEHIPEHIKNPKKIERKYSFVLTNEESFTGKILSRSLRVQSTSQDQSTYRINAHDLVEINRVEDTVFTPPKFKHFEIELRDGSHLIGNLLDKAIKVETSFKTSRQINMKDLCSVKLS